MTTVDLRSIYRRWKAGQSIRAISKTEGIDRNTAREYIRRFAASATLNSDTPKSDNEIMVGLSTILPGNVRRHSIRSEFESLEEKILGLLHDKDNPVKPKTAYEILKVQERISGSYESFKVFIRSRGIQRVKCKPGIPIEKPPGEEVQIDYGLVGMLYDACAKRKRRVNAFLGILACSRHQFIQFVFKQDEASFAASNVAMAEYYSGLPEHITIDNLKTGVIKPNLYDPKLNHAYAEFAEHYGVFINPCKIESPKEKGKVERSVPSARELFRKLVHLHPTYTLAELNREALRWCREVYGMRKHGTTGIEPVVLFNELEKPKLKPLPLDPFEICKWKQAKVHADRFVSVDQKRYAMPEEYRGRTVMVRKSHKTLGIFDQNHLLIREYVLTGRTINFLPSDFPEDKEAMMTGDYPNFLLTKARAMGPGCHDLIRSILKSHAYIHARTARGVISILEKYRDCVFLQEVCAKAARNQIHVPKRIQTLLEDARNQRHFEFIVPVSEAGKSMIRDVMDYMN